MQAIVLSDEYLPISSFFLFYKIIFLFLLLSWGSFLNNDYSWFANIFFYSVDCSLFSMHKFYVLQFICFCCFTYILVILKESISWLPGSFPPWLLLRFKISDQIVYPIVKQHIMLAGITFYACEYVLHPVSFVKYCFICVYQRYVDDISLIHVMYGLYSIYYICYSIYPYLCLYVSYTIF